MAKQEPAAKPQDQTSPETEAEKKLQMLVDQVKQSHRYFTVKKKSNRRPALIFKILTTGLSAVVTILLGVKNVGVNSTALHNIALGISAFMTIISAWGSFFDYNKLWVQYTKTADELELLLTDILFYQEGNTHVDLQYVSDLHKRYKTIVEGAAQYLHKVRSDDNSRKD